MSWGLWLDLLVEFAALGASRKEGSRPRIRVRVRVRVRVRIRIRVRRSLRV